MNNKVTKVTSRIPALIENQTVDHPGNLSPSLKADLDERFSRVSNRTRHGVIRENLMDGISFLREQDRLLAFAGQLLDEMRSLSGYSNPDNPLRRAILLQGLADIASTRYKQTLLFGNGAQSPLKIHVVVDDERKVIEIEQANLRQPGFQSILQCRASESEALYQMKPELAAQAIGEILNLRFSNQRQAQLLEAELARAEERIACSEATRRRLFGPSASANSASVRANSKSPLSRIGRTARLFGRSLSQRLKAFRPAEPVWEEIGHATLTDI